jgi:hypothetical protein
MAVMFHTVTTDAARGIKSRRGFRRKQEAKDDAVRICWNSNGGGCQNSRSQALEAQRSLSYLTVALVIELLGWWWIPVNGKKSNEPTGLMFS